MSADGAGVTMGQTTTRGAPLIDQQQQRENLIAAASEQFSAENPEHIAELQRLWHAAFPSVPWEGALWVSIRSLESCRLGSRGQDG